MFLARADNRPRCNVTYERSHFVQQQLDDLAFIDIFGSRIRAFHGQDAEVNHIIRVTGKAFDDCAGGDVVRGRIGPMPEPV